MSERRVLYVPFTPKIIHEVDGEDPYWDDFYAWLENQGGIEAIAYWLLHRDIEFFNPNFNPPMTDTKRDAIDAALPDDEAWLQDFKANPIDYVPKDRIAVTAAEMFMLYSGQDIMLADPRDLSEFTKAITNHMILKKVESKRHTFNGKKTSIYWVPGNENAGYHINKVKNNIRKFKI
jgi:hypothetical protein